MVLEHRARPRNERGAAPDRRAPSHVLIRAGDERSVSDGISTFVKVGALRVIALRASLVLGVLGLLWFLVAGPVGFVRARRLDWRQPAAAPFLGILALIVADFAARDGARTGLVATAMAIAGIPLLDSADDTAALVASILFITIGLEGGFMVHWSARALFAERQARAEAYERATLAERDRIAR